MKKTILSLAGLSVSAMILSSCASWHHSGNNANTHSELYQQCNGIKQQLIFADNSLNTNNTAQIQVDQQKTTLQQKYASLDCDDVLSGKTPASATIHENDNSQQTNMNNSANQGMDNHTPQSMPASNDQSMSNDNRAAAQPMTSGDDQNQSMNGNDQSMTDNSNASAQSMSSGDDQSMSDNSSAGTQSMPSGNDQSENMGGGDQSMSNN